jgi:hypothetical protein
MQHLDKILNQLQHDDNAAQFSFSSSPLNQITKFTCRKKAFELIQTLAQLTETKSFV